MAEGCDIKSAVENSVNPAEGKKEEGLHNCIYLTPTEFLLLCSAAGIDRVDGIFREAVEEVSDEMLTQAFYSLVNRGLLRVESRADGEVLMSGTQLLSQPPEDMTAAENGKDSEKTAEDETDNRTGSRSGSKPGRQAGSRPDHQTSSKPDHQTSSKPDYQTSSKPDSETGTKPGDQAWFQADESLSGLISIIHTARRRALFFPKDAQSPALLAYLTEDMAAVLQISGTDEHAMRLFCTGYDEFVSWLKETYDLPADTDPVVLWKDMEREAAGVVEVRIVDTDRYLCAGIE